MIEVVDPRTGQPVQVAAGPLIIKDQNGTVLGKGIIFDEPIRWLASDGLIGLQICDMCEHHEIRGLDLNGEGEIRYHCKKGDIDLEDRNSPCQHYKHAGDSDQTVKPACPAVGLVATRPTAASVTAWQLSGLDVALQLRPPIEYAIERLFEVPSLNMIYAPPGSHKSNIAYSIALNIATGKPWLLLEDEYLFKVPKKRNVLLIDQDNGPRRTADRLAMMAREMRITEASIKYVSMPDPMLLMEDIESRMNLVQTIRDSRAEVVIIDNLGTLLGSIDENTSDMASVMAWFRQIVESEKICLIILHHERKSNGEEAREGYRLRGHTSIEASLDNAYRIEVDVTDRTLITIRNTKSRGLYVEPFSLKWQFTPDEATGETVKAGFIGSYGADELTLNSQMLAVRDFIEGNGGEVSESKIAKGLDIKHKNGKDVGEGKIRKLLKRMVEENWLKTHVGPRGAIMYSNVAR